MGAFGYGSFDNDNALDFIPELINIKQFEKLVKKKTLDINDYDRLRAGCELVWILKEAVIFDEDLLPLLIKKLQIILADENYTASWREPEKIKRNIRGLIKKMEKLV